MCALGLRSPRVPGPQRGGGQEGWSAMNQGLPQWEEGRAGLGEATEKQGWTFTEGLLFKRRKETAAKAILQVGPFCSPERRVL